MKTETKLSSIFDFQRFARNKKLQSLIDDTESRYDYSLTDDDLEWVNAAGEEIDFKDKKDDDDDK